VILFTTPSPSTIPEINDFVIELPFPGVRHITVQFGIEICIESIEQFSFLCDFGKFSPVLLLVARQLSLAQPETAKATLDDIQIGFLSRNMPDVIIPGVTEAPKPFHVQMMQYLRTEKRGLLLDEVQGGTV
jgi:hypothetical protein